MDPRPIDPARWRHAQQAQRRYQTRKAVGLLGQEEALVAGAAAHSRQVHRRLSARFLDRDPEVVVEVGSGAHGLIWRWPAPTRVAVDPLACFYRAHFAALQADLRSVCQAMGEALPLQDGVADLVLSDNVIDHARDPGGLLEEAHRVLKPGGWLYLTVHVHHPVWDLGARLYNHLARLGVQLQVPAFPSHPFHFQRPAALRLVQKAGFDLVDVAGGVPPLLERTRRVRRLRDLPTVPFYKNQPLEIVARK